MTIMDERIPSRAISSSQIALLVRALESLTDGELAVDLLIAAGEGSILPLEEFLLRGKARTIAVPRCRAARALGGLRARGTLLSYFAKVDLPADPVVLFAEDAVRSAVAHELLHWRDDEVFYTLLKAATQRATVGLIESLGEFCRSEAIPVLFETLEDDLCRDAAFAALCKTPEESRHYAILSLRGGAGASLTGAAASRRRRATAELFRELGDFTRRLAGCGSIARRRGSHSDHMCRHSGLSRGSSGGVSRNYQCPLPGHSKTQLVAGR